MKLVFSSLLILLFSGICFGQSFNDNVVVVLDSSGSMEESMHGSGIQKLDAAKSALLEVLARIPDTTQVGILVFSSGSRHDEWIYPLSRKDMNKLAAAINLPSPGNGTPLGKYIKKGADALLEQRQKEHGYGTYRLLVVTDGEETQSTRFLEKVIPEVMARGITLDVIGVNMAEKHSLAQKVHSYRNANDPASLKKAVAEIFAEVSAKKDSSADAQAFEAIQGLPDDMILPIIKSLATSGNYPIGEKPAVKSEQQNVNAGEQVQLPVGKKDSSSIGKILVTVIFILFIIAVIAMIANSRRY